MTACTRMVTFDAVRMSLRLVYLFDLHTLAMVRSMVVLAIDLLLAYHSLRLSQVY